ncbi:DNA polymerase I [Candidatus Haloredivivus sp. G17]|nr:DNA polymerase I [Candidatus Haloredivivus sp. G17]
MTGLTLTGNFDLDLRVLYSGLSLVLLGVLAYFWNALDSPAGETWRNVIGAGIFVNLSAAILVLLNAYSAVIIELEHEHHFDWIAFVPRKNSEISTLNRYFGKADGKMVTAGIGMEQSSTPEIVKKCQKRDDRSGL